MKNFTLLATLLLAFVITGYSQDFGGTPPNCTLPNGYILTQGDRMVTYQNPLKNCADDCGILTPGVGGNNPGNILFPAEAPKPTLIKSFSIFVFDANLRCESDKDFQCSTFVSLYIVPESYTSVQPPSDADKFGESKPFLMKAHGGVNSVSVSFSKAYDPNKKYRVFLDFGKGTTCVQQDTKYIIDILPEGGPLPVNVSSFLVGRTGTAVALNWKTEIEMNAVNFEVQRSYDNASFKTIATIASTANGSSSKSYSYVDNSNTSKSISFYRLKIVKQSEVSYSDIKTVKGLLANTDFVIFPNPSVGNARVTITDLSEPTRVQLLDNSGRLVKSLMLNNTNTVELNGLQRGAYMVRIIGSISGNSEIRKLTVIN
ncbi:MAG: hypothetical protein JWO92_2202 [Chitinophagaceae bacterium]|nr:hypothetical protein [Chitinophagaceae bacterium]MDB5221455.1 hypothetical protein [Chitinophagaceae bacterium]